MSETFGMPGPGGSLGTCALCGKPFLTEILLGRVVKQFEIPQCAQRLFAHEKCLKEYEGKEISDLPDESPIKQAMPKP